MNRGTIIIGMAVLISISTCQGRVLAAFDNNDKNAAEAGVLSDNTQDLAFFIGEYSQSDYLHDRGLTDSENEALQQFYAARWNQPYWMNRQGPKPIVAGLIDTLRHADFYALNSDDFSDVISLQERDWRQSEPIDLARAEIRFMQAALLYGRQASAGRINPKKTGRAVSIQPDAPDPAKLLDRMSNHENPGLYLRNLHPQTAEYARLREVYLDYRNIEAKGGWPTIRRSGSLRMGRKSKHAATLRQRLFLSGDLPPGASKDNPLFYSELREALQRFQKRHGIKPDGVVGVKTRAALNVPVKKRIEQIALNLERRRWLPDDLGQRHVLVNQPEYLLRVVENGKSIHQTRVVIGKPSQQTPEFSDEIELVVLNPYWNVPRSIATKEILPILRRNPGYLSRKGMQLVNSRGKSVSPYRINWGNMSRRSFRYNIRQRPGSRNALGRIKFLFPNKHSVYLHDTPSKSLFRRSRRAFSHGCVRVQDPLKLAEVLMKPQFGWTKKTITRKISSRRNQAVRLKQSIPVHLTYHTVWMGEDGNVHFSEDMYGRDQSLATALNQIVPIRKYAEFSLSKH